MTIDAGSVGLQRQDLTDASREPRARCVFQGMVIAVRSQQNLHYDWLSLK